MEKKSKKKYLIGALALLLVAVAVGGTIAWLTASAHVTNTFAVGEINPPKDGDDDNKPDNPPEEPGDGEEGKFEGNIWEIFEENPVILPEDSITKTPYIGLGPDSQPAYIFAYVNNTMMADGADDGDVAHFTLGTGWKAVDGQAQQYSIGGVAQDGKYTGGLFVYCGSDEGATLSAPLVVEADDTDNVWTQRLFETVDFSADIQAADFVDKPTMDVHCFLYAAVNGATAEDAQNAAIQWVADGLGDIEGTATTA